MKAEPVDTVAEVAQELAKAVNTAREKIEAERRQLAINSRSGRRLTSYHTSPLFDAQIPLFSGSDDRIG